MTQGSLLAPAVRRLVSTLGRACSSATVTLKRRSRIELVFCHPERGTTYRAEAFQEALMAALRSAGVEGNLRAFHDLRHSSLMLGAASGEGAIALMARA